MKKNIGTYDALLRITCGLAGLAWGTARMVRAPYRGMPFLVTILSAMKVAEGITRFCPMLALFKTSSANILTFNQDKSQQAEKKQEEHKQSENTQGSTNQDAEDWPPFPPTFPMRGEHEQ